MYDGCFPGIYEKQNEVLAEEEKEEEYAYRVDAGENHAVADACLEPVEFKGAGILAAVGCHSGAQGVKDGAEEHAHACACRDGGDSV